jgi:hypothetical protein
MGQIGSIEYRRQAETAGHQRPLRAVPHPVKLADPRVDSSGSSLAKTAANDPEKAGPNAGTDQQP